MYRMMMAVIVLSLACGANDSDSQLSGDVQQTEGPESGIQSVDEDGTALNNTICPVMEAPVAAGQSFEWEGYTVGICCPGCAESFRAEPQRYITVLLEDPGVSQELKDELSTYLIEAD